MKQIFTILALAAILIVAFTFSNVAAQTPQPNPTTAVVTVTPVSQIPTNSVPMGWRMGMRGGMMAGAPKVQGHMGIMVGAMGVTENGAYGMQHGTMGAGMTPMHDDVALMLGMTAQDLYNQMASGKSMVQIAAERGITEQQLMNSIMSSRRAAYNRAVQAGYMTQVYADTMLQNMNNNLQMMVNGQGYGSNSWNMMWGTQSMP